MFSFDFQQVWSWLKLFILSKFFSVVFNVIYSLFDMQVYPEGTHFIIPWFERPVIYDVRARPHLVESTSGSRDLQMVIAFAKTCLLS